MKTICRLPDFTDGPNVSLYLFEDSKQVLIESDKTVIGDPSKPDVIIMDCNSSNVVLHEGVTDPDDWCGWKYFYTTDDGWVLNPNWVDPNLPVPPNPPFATDSADSESGESGLPE